MANPRPAIVAAIAVAAALLLLLTTDVAAAVLGPAAARPEVTAAKWSTCAADAPDETGDAGVGSAVAAARWFSWRAASAQEIGLAWSDTLQGIRSVPVLGATTSHQRFVHFPTA